MSRQTQGLISPAIMLIALIVVLCLSLFYSDYDNICGVDDNFVWKHVLSRTYDDGGNVSVNPTTSLKYFDNGDLSARLQAIRHITNELNIQDCGISHLVHLLFDRNRTSTDLELESNPQLGFIVDYNRTHRQYFSSQEGGGWERWYEDHPNSHGIITVSLPVCDNYCEIVLVYRGTQYQSLGGEGWVIAYRIKDSILVAVDSVMLWIS